MKQCAKCLQEKNETEFYTTTYKDKIYLLNSCKTCVNTRTHENYYKDHDRQKEIRKNNTNKRRAERKQKIIEYLQSHPCADCGEMDPVVLEFDHLDNKSFDISDGHMKPWKVFQDEINKCEVVCANCHKRRTAKRAGNWYKNIK
jgi:hypothetical protein